MCGVEFIGLPLIATSLEDQPALRLHLSVRFFRRERHLGSFTGLTSIVQQQVFDP
jgi:hypothetical protein